MTFFAGLLNFLGLLAWILLMLFLYAAGGGHAWESTTFFLYCCPLVYFVLSFLSTLPFARGPTMGYLGIAANLALVPFLAVSLSHGGAEGLIFGAPFLVLSALWYLAYRRRSRPVTANSGQSGAP